MTLSINASPVNHSHPRTNNPRIFNGIENSTIKQLPPEIFNEIFSYLLNLPEYENMRRLRSEIGFISNTIPYHDLYEIRGQLSQLLRAYRVYSGVPFRTFPILDTRDVYYDEQIARNFTILIRPLLSTCKLFYRIIQSPEFAAMLPEYKIKEISKGSEPDTEMGISSLNESNIGQVLYEPSILKSENRPVLSCIQTFLPTSGAYKCIRTRALNPQDPLHDCLKAFRQIMQVIKTIQICQSYWTENFTNESLLNPLWPFLADDSDDKYRHFEIIQLDSCQLQLEVAGCALKGLQTVFGYFGLDPKAYEETSLNATTLPPTSYGFIEYVLRNLKAKFLSHDSATRCSQTLDRDLTYALFVSPLQTQTTSDELEIYYPDSCFNSISDEIPITTMPVLASHADAIDPENKFTSAYTLYPRKNFQIEYANLIRPNVPPDFLQTRELAHQYPSIHNPEDPAWGIPHDLLSFKGKQIMIQAKRAPYDEISHRDTETFVTTYTIDQNRTAPDTQVNVKPFLPVLGNITSSRALFRIFHAMFEEGKEHLDSQEMQELIFRDLNF